MQRALGSLIMTCAPVSAGQGHLPGLDARVDGQEGGVGGPRAVGGVAGRARAAVGRAQLADGAARPERDVGEGVQAWGRQGGRRCHVLSSKGTVQHPRAEPSALMDGQLALKGRVGMTHINIMS